jgi:hypothetical protein
MEAINYSSISKVYIFKLKYDTQYVGKRLIFYNFTLLLQCFKIK